MPVFREKCEGQPDDGIVFETTDFTGSSILIRVRQCWTFIDFICQSNSNDWNDRIPGGRKRQVQGIETFDILEHKGILQGSLF